MPAALNLTGQLFGRLTAIERAGNNKHNHALWRCQCECGKGKVAVSFELKKGHVKSCGCLNLERVRHMGQNNRTHGHTVNARPSRAYATWCGMKNRCLKPKNKDYAKYGGRGIRVSKAWLDFVTFHADMGDPPKHMSLDRIDVNGDYCKENCRWADDETQQNNRRNSPKNRPEFIIHSSVVQHLEARGVSGLVYWHTPNGVRGGGPMARAQGALSKRQGVRAGVSDLILLHNGCFHALELKAAGKKPSPEQVQFLDDVEAAGGKAAWARGLDDALATLEQWGLLVGKTRRKVA